MASREPKVYHWKHGWIPLDHPAARRPDNNSFQFFDSMERAKAKDEAALMKRGRVTPVIATQAQLDAQPDLQRQMKENGGFTFDPRTGGLLEPGKAQGFAVAIPGTETSLGAGLSREEVINKVHEVIYKNADQIGRGAVVGGWYSPDRDEYMVELTHILPPDQKDRAVKLGVDRNQEAIFDLSTGETIPTGGTGG